MPSWTERNSADGLVTVADYAEGVRRERDHLRETLRSIANLTDKWLCQAVESPRVGEQHACVVMVAELRELLPDDSRYDNG